jgi:hypothetical protein
MRGAGMTEEPSEWSAWPCGHELADGQLFELYRNYIIHEDNLINNRVGWFIQLHSFLIASYGIVVAAIMATFFPQNTPAVPPIYPQAVACALLAGISLIGLRSSQSAEKSVDAAHQAIMALKQAWAVTFAERGAGTVLPGIIGGGVKEVEDAGALFHVMLPRSLRWLWYASFLVPVAFLGIASLERLSG